MTAPVREFTAGSAIVAGHDSATRHRLDSYRTRLRTYTNVQLLAAAYRAETLSGHGIADEIRGIVEHEVQRRRNAVTGFADWWLASIVGSTR